MPDQSSSAFLKSNQNGWCKQRRCAALPRASSTPLIVPIGGKAKPLKAPKKEKKELDDDELAFKEKQRAGEWPAVYMFVDLLSVTFTNLQFTPDAAAKKALLDATKGKKGPLNTGQQGIKKSGKK